MVTEEIVYSYALHLEPRSSGQPAMSQLCPQQADPMNTLALWHACTRSHLLCWRHSHSELAMPISAGHRC